MDNTCARFQSTVDEYLVRHRSILDVMSKLQESSARVSRAIVKSVTTCGCIEIDATKQPLPEDASLAEISEYVQTHLEGKICPNCLDVVEEELGKTLFYVAGICALLDLDFQEVLSRENDRIATLGVYSLT